ncbi:predicted protein [Nematostella vectensis]|uniref:BOD1/SHG1 domain-containing protein n=1 Tax=Nematostella vectensis TaxID=45351 RepID=A7RZK9_NEMVE|nr:predicted protein [Nematostella vectensis]|eukprot:XP_001635176.1 predicted protein [Nematostella vectensis]
MASAPSSVTATVSALDTKSRRLVDQIVDHFKRQGNFDELRRDCLDELDKMESFRQLNQRVESYVATFLSKQDWSDSLPKNQVRNSLRKHVNESDALKTGVDRLVSQALERKRKSFQMRIEGVVQNYIFTEKQKERQARWKARCDQNQSKQEPEKTDTKTMSTISSITDIISQIPGMQESPASTTEESSPKPSSSNSSSVVSKLSTTSTYVQAKAETKSETLSHHEQNKSSSSLTKQSPGLVRSLKGKRLAHKPSASASPGTQSPSDQKEKVISSSGDFGSKVKQLGSKVISRSASTESAPEKDFKSTKDSPVPLQVIEKAEPRAKDEESKAHVETLKGNELHRPPSLNTDLSSKSALVTEPDSQESDLEATATVSSINTEPHKTSKHSNKQDFKETLPDLAISRKEKHEKKATQMELNGEKEEVGKRANIISEESQPCEVIPEDKQESDDDSDISDVSSVHTSDLSSFDEDLSSESDNESTPGAKEESMPQDRSKPRTNKTNDIKKQAHGEMNKVSKHATEPSGDSDSLKRRRGRPRKEEKTSSDNKREQMRQPRSRKREDSAGDNNGQRIRSKRMIKRKRCYSPSSESTREVRLPSKHTRTGSWD